MIKNRGNSYREYIKKNEHVKLVDDKYFKYLNVSIN